MRRLTAEDIHEAYCLGTWELMAESLNALLFADNDEFRPTFIFTECESYPYSATRRGHDFDLHYYVSTLESILADCQSEAA